MKTYIYIDGFNLFRGCLGSKTWSEGKCKWLDLYRFCRRKLIKTNVIMKIKYFTAVIDERPENLGGPQRQRTYLRALKTHRIIDVIEGHFRTKPILGRICWDEELMEQVDPKIRLALQSESITHIPVFRTEEKQSDVNLGCHMILDASRGVYDQAVLIANDADYAGALDIVTGHFGRRVGLINPFKESSKHLKRYALFVRDIVPADLKQCQFPLIVTDNKGREIRKPHGW